MNTIILSLLQANEEEETSSLDVCVRNVGPGSLAETEAWLPSRGHAVHGRYNGLSTEPLAAYSWKEHYITQ